jgi:hypothetical protein
MMGHTVTVRGALDAEVLDRVILSLAESRVVPTAGMVSAGLPYTVSTVALALQQLAQRGFVLDAQGRWALTPAGLGHVEELRRLRAATVALVGLELDELDEPDEQEGPAATVDTAGEPGEAAARSEEPPAPPPSLSAEVIAARVATGLADLRATILAHRLAAEHLVEVLLEFPASVLDPRERVCIQRVLKLVQQRRPLPGDLMEEARAVLRDGTERLCSERNTKALVQLLEACRVAD